MTVLFPDILHIEACNFIDKPMGGQLNFSRQLIKAFKNRLALVGWTNTDSEPIGQWYQKEIDGIKYHFFAIGRDRASNEKPILPARLITWMQLRKYQVQIFSIEISNILIREHSILLGLKNDPKFNICYYFPGVESPLSISRYSWAKLFSYGFDQFFFKDLAKKAKCILAAADEESIQGLKQRMTKYLNQPILQFPTRVDTTIFKPGNKKQTRIQLKQNFGTPMISTIGRIHWAKGWSFLLDAFQLFHEKFPKAVLVFLGDGVEKKKLIERVITKGLEKNVIVAGHQPPNIVSKYLSASDLFIMGSFKEGWSTSLVEALACHLPIVTTMFSSAQAIVEDGVNGYVVARDEKTFAHKMEDALFLENVSTYSKLKIPSFSLDRLAIDLLKIWSID